MSTTDATFRACDPQGWDWGQVGFVFASAEDIRAEHGVRRISRGLRGKVEDVLLAEVESYDQYLRGDAYCYAIDPAVQVLLLGANGWLWALTEYSDAAPDDYPHLAFGWVAGDFPELGYVPMDELDELNAGCLDGAGYVWADESFTPRPLSQVQAEADETHRLLRESPESGERVVVRLTTIGV